MGMNDLTVIVCSIETMWAMRVKGDCTDVVLLWRRVWCVQGYFG